jgi:hypothetical protein
MASFQNQRRTQMQITINTADILGDEATIRNEVIEQVSQALITSMRTQAKAELTEMLKKNLGEVVTQVTTDAITITMDTKFTDTDQYGRSGKEASIRERIADYVQAQCTFKQANYSSDRNPFTAVVTEVVQKEVVKFKSDFTSLVTQQVIKQNMDMAVTKLKESLGIK